MYFPYRQAVPDQHDPSHCGGICDGERHMLKGSICRFCKTKAGKVGLKGHKTSLCSMHRHVSEKCVALSEEDRATLGQAFYSIEGEEIDKGRKHLEKVSIRHKNNPLSAEEKRIRKVRERKAVRKAKAVQKGVPYQSSDEDDADLTDHRRKVVRLASKYTSRPPNQGTSIGEGDEVTATRRDQNREIDTEPGRLERMSGKARVQPAEGTCKEESHLKSTPRPHGQASGVYSIEASESSDNSLPDLPSRLPKARKGGRRPSPQTTSSKIEKTLKGPIDSSDDDRPLKRSRETRTEMSSSPVASTAPSAPVSVGCRPQQRLEVVVPFRSASRREPPDQGDSAATSKAASRESSISVKKPHRQTSIARSSTIAIEDSKATGARKTAATKAAVIDLTSDSAESSDERPAVPVVSPAARASKERGGSNSDVEMAMPDREEQENDESEQEEPFFPFYDPTDVSETESLMDYKLEREIAILQDPYAASVLHLKLQPLPKELQPFKPLLADAGIRNKTDLLANVRPHRIKRFVDFLIERFPAHLDTPVKRFSLEERLEDALA